MLGKERMAHIELIHLVYRLLPPARFLSPSLIKLHSDCSTQEMTDNFERLQHPKQRQERDILGLCVALFTLRMSSLLSFD